MLKSSYPNSLFNSHADYTSLLQTRPVKIAEQPIRIEHELDLQAKLYYGEFGNQWTTCDGRKVIVRHFGDWNREAGPDFRNGCLQFDDGEVLRGDIEVDLLDTSWEQHGHGRNADFNRVLLHICFEMASRRGFARTSDHREVPQVCLYALTETPTWQSTVENSPSTPLNDTKLALRLIQRACEYRLLEKHRRLATSCELHGRPNSIYYALATALGYKGNQIPFLLLAQRARLPRILKSDGEALLFGIAGFLQADLFEAAHPSTRSYIKKLWDSWWLIVSAEQRLVLPKTTWRLHSLRPANHPHRRIGALRILGQLIPKLLVSIDKLAIEDFLCLIKSVSHPFWDHHWNLKGHPLPNSSSAALIGSERANDILINVFFPYIINTPKGYQAFANQKSPSIPSRIRSARDWFCPLLDEKLLYLAWIQQGLIQLASDFRGNKSPHELR